jgi:hypothetical protein
MIFNITLEVNPSIRSPVRNDQYLRFGQTQKYCRSDPRCNHCDVIKNSIGDCPNVSSTDPSYRFHKLLHVASECSCQEWIDQNKIKKIMANENISYQDAYQNE